VLFVDKINIKNTEKKHLNKNYKLLNNVIAFSIPHVFPLSTG
jgi:hypothetical protein